MSTCVQCQQPLQGDLAPHICLACKRPQPLMGDEDFFQAFQMAPRFQIERASLDRHFFALSRALHPDRFSLSLPEIRQASLDRMSLINNAYQALSRPEERRVYLLKRNGLLQESSSGERRQKAERPVSMEWAERWFDLQDELDELDSVVAQERLMRFLEDLSAEEREVHSLLQDCERRYDVSLHRDELTQIEELMGRIAYFASLKRNVERARQMSGI